MLALFCLKNNFFANLTFGWVTEARDCMSACLRTWNHLLAIGALNIVHRFLVIRRLIIFITSLGSSASKLLFAAKNLRISLTFNVQHLHIIYVYWCFTNATAWLLLLALLCHNSNTIVIKGRILFFIVVTYKCYWARKLFVDVHVQVFTGFPSL